MEINLYNLDQFVRNKTSNKQKAFYYNQECAIIQGSNGVVIAYFNNSHITYKSIHETISIETIDAQHENMPIADDCIKISIKEVIEAAPCTEIDSREYFHKRYIEGDIEKLQELKTSLISIGFDKDIEV